MTHGTGNRIAGLVGAFLLLAGTAVQAQGMAGVGKGDSEFGIFAKYTTLDDVNSDLLLLGASFGSFVSDSLELRITPVLIYGDFGVGAVYGFNPQFTVEYLFRNASPVVPFVGGGLGINLNYTEIQGPSGDQILVALNLVPTAGAKIFLSERTALELALTYQFGIGESCDDIDCYSTETSDLQQLLKFNFYY